MFWPVIHSGYTVIDFSSPVWLLSFCFAAPFSLCCWVSGFSGWGLCWEPLCCWARAFWDWDLCWEPLNPWDELIAHEEQDQIHLLPNLVSILYLHSLEKHIRFENEEHSTSFIRQPNMHNTYILSSPLLISKLTALHLACITWQLFF